MRVSTQTVSTQWVLCGQFSRFSCFCVLCYQVSLWQATNFPIKALGGLHYKFERAGNLSDIKFPIIQ